MNKYLVILFLSIFMSLNAQTYNYSYLLNKPASVFRGLMLLNDTLLLHGYVAEPFPPYPVKYIVAKFDLNGNPILGYSAMLDSFTDYFTQNHFIITKDSGIAFVGIKDLYQGGVFFKISKQGNIKFVKKFIDSTAWAYGFKNLIQLEDSSYLILGLTSSIDLVYDLTITKTNPSGNLVWTKKIGSSILTEMPSGIFQLNNGNILIGADQGNFAPYQVGYSNTYLLEIDTGGTIIKEWTDTTKKTFGPTAYIQQPNGDAIYCSVHQDTVISTGGNPTNYASLHTGYIVREDSLHHKIWEVQLGFRSSIPALFQMKKLLDGNYLAVGGTYDTTYTDGQPYKNTGWLVKFDENGTVIWQRKYFNTTDVGGQVNYLYDFVELPDGGIIACGERIDWFTDYPQRGWLLRLDNFGCLIPGCESVGLSEDKNRLASLKVYPNPVGDVLYTYFDLPDEPHATYRLKITSIDGRQMQSINNLQNQATYTISTQNYASGLYLVGLYKDEQLIKSNKIIKQ